jgi:hypothetical protein
MGGLLFRVLQRIGGAGAEFRVEMLAEIVISRKPISTKWFSKLQSTCALLNMWEEFFAKFMENPKISSHMQKPSKSPPPKELFSHLGPQTNLTTGFI